MSADRSLRVGLELTGLELDAGGGARAVEGLRRGLAEREDVELWTISQPSLAGGRVVRGLARELAWFPVALPRRARRAGIDLLHCPLPLAPRRSPVPLVVTVGDALAWERPEWFTRVNALHAQYALAPALRRAARVLVPSEDTRSRLAATLDLDPARIAVTPWGVDERFSPGPRPDELLERLGVRGPYALAVGTLQPRKNLEASLAAFERVADDAPEHALVIAGARGWRDAELLRRVERSPAAARIHLLGRVSDEDLASLYRGAECLLFPSRGEGFGLPALEAMGSGCPVICSDQGGLPEVVGDAALLVDPDNLDALTRALGELLGSAARRRELAERGVERARAFTWERCAELTVAAYRDAVAEKMR